MPERSDTPTALAAREPAAPAASALGVSAVVGATLAWTAGTLLVKSLDASAIWITFWRFVVALPLGLAFLFHAGWDRGLRNFRAGWLGGALFGMHVLVYFSAVRATSVAVVTFVAALQPVLVMLVAGRWLGERVTPTVVLWGTVAIGGVALVVLGSAAGGDTSTFGNVLSVVNLFIWTAYFLLSKRLRDDIDAVPYQGVILVVSCAVVTPIALLLGHDGSAVRSDDWFAIVLIAVVPSLGHLMVNWAHRYVAASVSSLVVLTVPVLSGVGAAILLDEPFGPLQIAGGALVLVSTGFVVRHSTKASGIIPPEDV
ncbi:MAG: DMT family transporter [Actinobacteria bacterium ATB1]|nr:DMT family transporter [Actinobacteria bacterium ATB1]